HSATQFPDFFHATIDGKAAPGVIGDDAWLQGDYLTKIQKRGAAVIEARGASSAASAANAAIDTVKAVRSQTPAGECFSAAICSDGSYGVDKGLIFGFPLTSDGQKWSIEQGIQHNAFAQEKINATLNELREERDTVKDLLPG
ncbi:MAG: malate dehydrogenase, partial [Planctomycetaceae bacterium]|nr:malate dehydrogenase [Planctomycetaceae bacterium]